MACRYAVQLDVGIYCRSTLRAFGPGSWPVVKSCEGCPVADKLHHKPRPEIDGTKPFAELRAAKPVNAGRRTKACVHRGTEKIKTVLCPSCCGRKTRIFLFKCNLLGGLCSIATDVGEKVCDPCGKYESV